MLVDKRPRPYERRKSASVAADIGVSNGKDKVGRTDGDLFVASRDEEEGQEELGSELQADVGENRYAVNTLRGRSRSLNVQISKKEVVNGKGVRKEVSTLVADSLSGEGRRRVLNRMLAESEHILVRSGDNGGIITREILTMEAYDVNESNVIPLLWKDNGEHHNVPPLDSDMEEDRLPSLLDASMVEGHEEGLHGLQPRNSC